MLFTKELKILSRGLRWSGRYSHHQHQIKVNLLGVTVVLDALRRI